jgi:hypothetical protein
MDHPNQSLQSHKRAFEELIKQSSAAGILYTDAELATKFVMSLSNKWVEKKADIEALPDASKPQTVAAAIDSLTTWATSQVRNYGSIGGFAGTGMQYAAYAVRMAGSQEKSKRSCFNFKKGYCSRGDDCRFVHDTDGHDADSDDQAAVAAAEAAGVQKAKDGSPICLVCWGVNHCTFECPSVKRNKA